MTTGDPQFEGVYGPYTITSTDRQEVQRYRISLLVAGLADDCSVSSLVAVWRQLGLDLAYAIHGRTRLGTEVDPHLSTTTPQRAEVVLVDRLPGLGTPFNASWSE